MKTGGGGFGQGESFAEDAQGVQKPVSGGLSSKFPPPLQSLSQEYKAKCPSYFKEDDDQNKGQEDKDKDKDKKKEEKKEEDKEERKVCKSWDFKEQLVFQRFDSFVERLKTIQDFCNTANQFLKLEKVDILISSSWQFIFRWKLVESEARCSPRPFRRSTRRSARFTQFSEIGVFANPWLRRK